MQTVDDHKRTVEGLVMIAVVVLGAACGPDLSEFQHLRDPRVTHKPPLRMLVTELTGAPAETVGPAFKALYGVRYSLDNPDDGLEARDRAPRARWPVSVDTPDEQWRGIFGVPISKSIAQLPAEAAETKPPVRLETWEYGTVGEILHIGSYDSEPPTVDRLFAFVREKECTITGLHEEEYLKGPGMFLAGNPDEYQTIIRYPLRCPRP